MKPALVLAAAIAAFGTTLAAQVPYSRIVNAAKEPGAWLTYNGTYDGQRYSLLTQISTSNVSQLQPAWVYQIRGDGQVETSPIVVDGRMYVTEPPTTVTALDPRTGRALWSYVRPMPSGLRLIGFPATNRGVAILDDMLYVGSLDGYLIALDAETGAKRWETMVADNGVGHSVTMAPLALDGKIIVGISGGEAGVRGFVDAYHAKTGKLLWRTHTVPAAGEPGVDTWEGESWKNGAGATWLTGSYDPELRS
jgi:alcohol dehydrogenase (cytochrome c)